MPPRVALFLDYENFYTGLRLRGRRPDSPYGETPRLDFERLVAFVNRHFGALAPEDFIVVANFAHFNRQKGGLDRVASVVDVHSFRHRHDRREQQPAPGKLHVEKNYADLRLAFEAGQHAAQRPADIYLLASGDGAFAALAQALLENQLQPVFMLADPDKASRLIRDGFKWFDVVKSGAVLAAPAEAEAEPDVGPDLPAGVIAYLAALSRLRQEFSSPVPRGLLRAVFGPPESDDLQRQAYGRGLLDEWKDPAGVVCLSRREERVQGKIYPLPVHPSVAEAARVLEAVALIGLRRPQPERAFWRRALKEHTGLSTHAVKDQIERLLQVDILREAELDHARLDLERVLRFMRG